MELPSNKLQSVCAINVLMNNILTNIEELKTISFVLQHIKDNDVKSDWCLPSQNHTARLLTVEHEVHTDDHSKELDFILN